MTEKNEQRGGSKAWKITLITAGIAIIVLGFILLLSGTLDGSFRKLIFMAIISGGWWLASRGISMGDSSEDDSDEEQESVSVRGGSSWKRVLKRISLWTVGIFAAMFVAFFIWAIVDDDNDNDTVEIENFDENREAYFVGGTDDQTIILEVQLNKDMTLRSENVKGKIPGVEGWVQFNVEENGPDRYVMRADGNPGVWGGQLLTLDVTTEGEENKIIITGTFTDTDMTDKEANFLLLQPEQDENYYYGTVGEDDALFMLKEADGSFTGTMLCGGADPVTIAGSFNGKRDPDEGGAIYSVSGPDFSMEISWWSDGGDNGFYGEMETEQGRCRVSTNNLMNYEIN